MASGIDGEEWPRLKRILEDYEAGRIQVEFTSRGYPEGHDPRDWWTRETLVQLLRDRDERQFRRMAKKGELDGWIQAKADQVRAEAESLIAAGMDRRSAWLTAREEIIYGDDWSWRQ